MVLAVIGDDNSNEQVKQSMNPGCPGTWIGISDAAKEGTFRWNGKREATYLKFENGAQSLSNDFGMMRTNGLWRLVGAGFLNSCLTCSSNLSLKLKRCTGWSWEGFVEFQVMLNGEVHHLKQYDLTSFNGGQTLYVPIRDVPDEKVGQVMSLRVSMRPGTKVCLTQVNIFNAMEGNTVLAAIEHPVVLHGSTCKQDFFRASAGSKDFYECYHKPYEVFANVARGQYKVSVHSCNVDGALAKGKNLFMTVTGDDEAGEQRTTEQYKLQSDEAGNDNFAQGTWHNYYISTDMERFDHLVTVNVGILEQDEFCFDDVVVNDQRVKTITHNWIIGSSHSSDRCEDNKQCPYFSLAVFRWPVCGMEIISIRPVVDSAARVLDEQSTVAGLTCLNYGRLTPQVCQVQQDFQFTTQIEQTFEFTTEQAQRNSFSVERSASITASKTATLTVKKGVVSASSSATVGVGVSLGATSGNEWSRGKSETNSESVVSTTGKSILCSASIEVPPSHKIPYSLTFNKESNEIQTMTDIKLTLCKLEDGQSVPDEHNVVNLFDQPGRATVEQMTTCTVVFEQAQMMPNKLTCAEEAQISMQKGAPFVPECQDNNPKLYKPCQCQKVDQLSAAACMCTTEHGDPKLDGSLHMVEPNETWQQVCQQLDCA